MADFAAASTGVAHAAADRPSAFELAAQEGMGAMLRPALRYLLAVLAQRRPPSFGGLLARLDEAHAVLSLVLQWHHLRTYGGSFAEVFYGLKRVPVAHAAPAKTAAVADGNGSGATRLTARQRTASLLVLVVAPYIRTKCDAWYAAATRAGGSGDPEPRHPPGVLGTVRSAALALYPAVHAAWEALALLFQVAYLFGHTEFFSPSLALTGLALRRMTLADMLAHRRAQAARQMARVAPPGAGIARRVLQPVAGAAQAALEYSQVAIPVAVFFLRFLEWWYNSSEGASAEQPMPIPPPPDPPKVHPDGIALPSDAAACPLCRRSRANPSVLLSSGHAFCHTCISAHVSEHGRCPVTFVPADAGQIVRIYTGAFS